MTPPSADLEQKPFLGALQFTRRLLALTGLDLSAENWRLPDGDPFVEATGLTQALASELVSEWQEDFKCILQSVDLS